MTSEISSDPRVVIIGAGFGGLWAARALSRAPAEVTLIDRNNYHTFLPLLYQVAAAELEPEDIAYPVRSVVSRYSRTSFRMNEVRNVDFEKRVVETDGPPVPYDYLVVAMGTVTHFFGVQGASEHSFPLKTMEEGIALRNHILTCFERAVHEPDEERRRQLLTFAIVGGGPTGVEFAGALAELVRGPLAKDFRRLDLRDIRIVLLEAMGGLLSILPERLGLYARDRLGRMGVDVQLQAKVSGITERNVTLADGTVIPTDTVVWTAGVRGEPVAEAWPFPAGRDGRLRVLPTLQLADHPDVYVIGDLARIEQDGGPVPMLAPAAIQQGRMAAENIARQIAGKEAVAFRYRDPGTMVTIGRNAAVAHVGGRSFTGFPAWVLWLTIHLFKLIGFHNRIFVLINWAMDYFLYERAVRLILPKN